MIEVTNQGFCSVCVTLCEALSLSLWLKIWTDIASIIGWWRLHSKGDTSITCRWHIIRYNHHLYKVSNKVWILDTTPRTFIDITRRYNSTKLGSFGTASTVLPKSASSWIQPALWQLRLFQKQNNLNTSETNEKHDFQFVSKSYNGDRNICHKPFLSKREKGRVRCEANFVAKHVNCSKHK